MKQHAFIVRELTMRELRRKYARSALGILWSVLNPLLSMAVLSLIFSGMFRRSIENYPIYYLCGYLIWQMFTAATMVPRSRRFSSAASESRSRMVLLAPKM